MVRLSQFPIQTYAQLIGLTRALRATLPPLIDELSFLPDRAGSVLATAGVSPCEHESECIVDDMGATLPTADAFACLVAPCTSLRKLELGALVGCGLPQEFSADGSAPHPPWIVRAFAHNATALRSLFVLGPKNSLHGSLKPFAVDAVFVAHLIACLPALEELFADAPALRAPLSQCSPHLRVLRVHGVLGAGLREWLFASPPPLPNLAELHIDDSLPTRHQLRAAQLGLAVVPSGRRCLRDEAADGCEDPAVRALEVAQARRSAAVFRLRCPALRLLEWRAFPMPAAVDVDPATASSLRVLRLLDARQLPDVRPWVVPFSNLRVLAVTGVSQDRLDLRSLCEDPCVAPRLAVLECNLTGVGEDALELRCKGSLADFCLSGCRRMQLSLASSPALMRLETDARQLHLGGCWPRLASLSAGGLVSVQPTPGSGGCAAADGAAPRPLPALREYCSGGSCRSAAHVRTQLRILEFAQHTLRRAVLELAPHALAPADNEALLAFACQHLPRLVELAVDNVAVGVLDVRLPVLRRLSLGAQFGGCSSARVCPLLAVPCLEKAILSRFPLPPPRDLFPLHIAPDGRLRLKVFVSLPDNANASCWEEVGAIVHRN